MAKDTMNISLVPGERDAVVADLFDVCKYGFLHGVDFRPMTRTGRRKSGEARSRLAVYAFHLAGIACRKELVPPVPALPETTGTTDADRLAAAMAHAGIASPKALATMLGYADKASVQNVKTKGMKLTGRLLAWVESVEAGR